MVWLHVAWVWKNSQSQTHVASVKVTVWGLLAPSKVTVNLSNRTRLRSSAYRLAFSILPIIPLSMCASSNQQLKGTKTSISCIKTQNTQACALRVVVRSIIRRFDASSFHRDPSIGQVDYSCQS